MKCSSLQWTLAVRVQVLDSTNWAILMPITVWVWTSITHTLIGNTTTIINGDTRLQSSTSTWQWSTLGHIPTSSLSKGTHKLPSIYRRSKGVRDLNPLAKGRSSRSSEARWWKDLPPRAQMNKTQLCSRSFNRWGSKSSREKWMRLRTGLRKCRMSRQTSRKMYWQL